MLLRQSPNLTPQIYNTKKHRLDLMEHRFYNNPEITHRQLDYEITLDDNTNGAGFNMWIYDNVGEVVYLAQSIDFDYA